MTRRTPPTSQEWYDATRARIAATGYRPRAVDRVADLAVRPASSCSGTWSRRARSARAAAPAGSTASSARRPPGDGGDYVVWRDDVAHARASRATTSPLPFVAVPDAQAPRGPVRPGAAPRPARMGELHGPARAGRRPTSSTCRGRRSCAGATAQEHLHWWVLARPTGADQLARRLHLRCGTTSLPPRPPTGVASATSRRSRAGWSSSAGRELPWAVGDRTRSRSRRTRRTGCRCRRRCRRTCHRRPRRSPRSPRPCRRSHR